MDTTYIYNPTTDTLYLMLYILGASRHEIWFALEYPDLIKQVQEKPSNISKNKRTFSQTNNKPTNNSTNNSKSSNNTNFKNNVSNNTNSNNSVSNNTNSNNNVSNNTISNDSSTTCQIINCKALKVYKKQYEKYSDREYATKDLLLKNNQKSPNLIYPYSKFNTVVDKKEYIAIVYDVMFSSLHDVIKQYTENNQDRKISETIVSKIIPQIVDATNFMHSCGYMHTDIKLKNILIEGVSQLTVDIMNYAQTYNLISKLPKTINKNNVVAMITKAVDTFVENICKKFNLKFDDDSDDNSSDENDDNNNDNSNSDNSGDVSCYNSNYDSDTENSDYSDESSMIESQNPDMKTMEYDEDGSYSDSFNSYNSGGQLYTEIYDDFHTKYIIKKLKTTIPITTSSASKTISKPLLNKRFEEAKRVLENPIIKLADFDNIEKCSYNNRTIQNRPFRAPEIVLGLEYNEKIDHWSIGILILTMLLGKPFVDASKENMSDTHDLDFVTIKLFLEKICYTKEQQRKLLDLVNSSLRTGYFLNNDKKTLKFLTDLDFDFWINHVDNTKIIGFINGCLDMNANNRKLVW